jgi:hypothetical protein
MMSKLGVLLVEQEDGQTSVQLFAEPDGAREAFRQLKCLPKQLPFRATFIDLDWQGKVVTAESRNLPEIEDAESRPDGWKLGEGPIFFPQESGKKKSGGDISGKTKT